MAIIGAHAKYDSAISIPTLIGSVLSMVATASVILIWIIARGKQRRDFRYALILNLAVAEFLNSLNNSISGFAVVITHSPLVPGVACRFNGWAGQFSVTAIDFSILAITLVTLLTIQVRSFVIYASTTTKALICLSIWIIPLCTSIIALLRDYYGPVSGNWCWIEKRFTLQRYLLNHAWRFAIFFVSMFSYVYIFVYMSRRMRPQHVSIVGSSDLDSIDCELMPRKDYDAVLAGCGDTPRISVEEKNRPSTPIKRTHRRNLSSFSFAGNRGRDNFPPEQDGDCVATPCLDIEEKAHASSSHQSELSGAPSNEKDLETVALNAPAPFARTDTRISSRAKIDRDIGRMLLLNMYPVSYIVLWLPGIANRVAEGMGHEVRILAILQSSTQFIGLVDAMIYVYQEHRSDVRRWLSWSHSRRV
ncbi:hypothetical protein FB567DRAFT_616864 [Paraphoma chrysanthemicola]|uniref:G-protein coupled receptors family 1 profile domain-containing protein n=1 Tax=Paraphoma chrysanthemicola TaxID=798071 RepID=A0A8K0W1K5_9PLEO|nr:hypothetical protein FB567DRAFT_616864 [Paraphoma chrysanthemicola]